MKGSVPPEFPMPQGTTGQIFSQLEASSKAMISEDQTRLCDTLKNARKQALVDIKRLGKF